MPFEAYTGIDTKGVFIISLPAVTHPATRPNFSMAYQRKFIARQRKMTGRPEL